MDMHAQTGAPVRSDMWANQFIGAVLAAGAAAIAASLYKVVAGGLEAAHMAWIGLAVLTLAFGRLSVSLPIPHCRVSFSDAFIFLSVLAFGPDLATLTAALDGFAASVCQKGTTHKKAFNTAGMALSVYLSSHFFVRLLPADGLWSPHLPAVDLLLPVAALALAQYVLNTALVATVVSLNEHTSFVAIWQDSTPWAGTAYLAGSVVAALVFLAVREIGVLSSFAILPFPAILYLTYRLCLSRLGKVKEATVPRTNRS